MQGVDLSLRRMPRTLLWDPEAGKDKMTSTSKTFVASAATLFASAFLMMTAPAAQAEEYCITNGAQAAHRCGYPTMETSPRCGRWYRRRVFAERREEHQRFSRLSAEALAVAPKLRPGAQTNSN